MLQDMLKELSAAIDQKDKKTAARVLKDLSIVGVDVYTALVLVKELNREDNNELV